MWSIVLAWVQVNLVDAIGSGGLPRSSSAEGECLHCALSVIMNVTHHNAAGCQQARLPIRLLPNKPFSRLASSSANNVCRSNPS